MERRNPKKAKRKIDQKVQLALEARKAKRRLGKIAENLGLNRESATMGLDELAYAKAIEARVHGTAELTQGEVFKAALVDFRRKKKGERHGKR